MTDLIETVSPTRTVCYADGHDLDASRAFYTGVLGLDVAMEDPVLGLTSAANRTAQILIPPAGFDQPQPRFGIESPANPLKNTETGETPSPLSPGTSGRNSRCSAA